MERKITHMRQKKIFAALAAVIAIVMVITSLNFNFAYAGEVDNETVNSYEDSLGMGNVMSTENAGRIWTDKSVYNEDINLDFAEAGGDSYTVQIGEEEAFLVSYSALALSERITGKTQAPVDVVFVIDISGSMNEDLGDGTRISKTIDALNSSIDKLMKMNSYTRVGVVAYSNTSREILPLDHYTTNRTDGKYFYMNDGKDRLRWDLKTAAVKM